MLESIASLLLLATAVLYTTVAQGPTSSSAAKPGDPCTVPYPLTCGTSELVDEVITKSDKYGPNVCIYNETYEVVAYSYTYKQAVCLSRRFLICLPPVCSPTAKCDKMLNITISRLGCCQGYAASPSSEDDDFYFQFDHGRPHGDSGQRGCPIELKRNVVECLNNLSDFKALLDTVPSLTTLLSDTSTHYTILAVPNNSSGYVGSALTSDGIARFKALSRQIINGTVAGKYLYHGSVYHLLTSSDNIHVTRVAIESRGRFDTVFLNGLQVLSQDLCLATNGLVHVINGFVPAASGSIASILSTRPEFGLFNALVRAAGVSYYLEFMSPKTVFVPKNDSFPAGALECLKAPRNRQALQKIVLLHITQPAEYRSSLSLRTVVATAARVYLRVQTSNGTVYLTRNRIPITEPDIQATNGVVHGLSRVIFGEVDYKRVCPPAIAITPTSAPATVPPTGPVAGAMEALVQNLGIQFPSAPGPNAATV